MNINDYIRDLSIKDKKTLSQKTLKLVEEVGELAKVILPFDSAPGTSHRFTHREKILEEVVDVYLTNISIAHSLGFTDEEFNDMLLVKTKKWSELQSKEDEVTYPLPFEIHITVDLKWGLTIDNFKYDCSQLGVKPIILDLEINGLDSIKDVMTSSKHFGDNRSAYEESNRIVNSLKDIGYKVVRSKIETVPWHPAAPTVNTGEKIPNDCYFESHIGVMVTTDTKEELVKLVNDLNDGTTAYSIPSLNGSVRLSTNFLKKSKDGNSFINMLTYRDSITCRKEFIREVDIIKEVLNLSGFEFEKVEVEYAIYDSNVSHDAKWILS